MMARLGESSRGRGRAKACRHATVILGLGLFLLPAIAWATPPRGGELLLIDRDPRVGDARNAIVAVSLETAEVRLVANPGEMVGPRGLTWGIGKRLYVGDGDRLWRIDSYEEANSHPHAITSSYLFSVADLLQTSSGDFYVLDQYADPLGELYSGALLRLDPETEALTVVVSDPRFVGPGSIVEEPEGTLLILDRWGRMEVGGPASGAIYRIDPVAQTVTPLLSLDFLGGTTHPAAIGLAPPDTLLLLDAELSVPGLTPEGGALLRIALETGTVIDTVAVAEFRDPIDLVRLPDGGWAVIDAAANPNGHADAQGALIQFGPALDEAIEVIAWSGFGQLTTLGLFDGPDLDTSDWVLTDLTPAPVWPGDRVRFEATLISTGPGLPGAVEMTASLDSLACHLGSAEIDRGTVALDPQENRLIWSLSLDRADSARLTVDLSVPSSASGETPLPIEIEVSGGWVAFQDRCELIVERVLSPGTMVYVDADDDWFPAPRLFTLNEDGETLDHYLADPEGLLPKPVDLCFGADGLIYVINGSGAPSLVRLDPRDLSLTLLHEGAPMLAPSGICAAHAGEAVLIADPQWAGAAGVVWRYDLGRDTLEVLFTSSDLGSLAAPVDICPDRDGHYLVVDYESRISGEASGALFEIDSVGSLVKVYTAPTIFRDPYSLVVAENGSVFVTDIAPGAPAIVRMQRLGAFTGYNRVAGASDALLGRPVGIERLGDLELVICDYEPREYLGGLTHLFSGDGIFWDLEELNFSSDLRQPRRSAAWRQPAPVCTELTLENRPEGALMPGDTLIARAVIVNQAPVTGSHLAAAVRYSDALLPLAGSATGGELRGNPDFGSFDWSGELRFLDADSLTLTFLVDSLAPHAMEIEVQVETQGGEEREPVTVRDTLLGHLQGGELLLLDAAADPFQTGDRGAVFVVETDPERFLPYRSHPDLREPVDLLAEGPQRLLLLDGQADPLALGEDTGALFALERGSESLRVVVADPLLVAPRRVLGAPDGGWWILDAGTQQPGSGEGAVLHLAGEGEEPTLFAADNAFRGLSDMTLDGQQRLWVTDREADPLGTGVAGSGAVFVIDATSGELLETIAGEDLVAPEAILYVEGEGLLFTDPGWTDTGGNTGVRRIDPQTGEISPLLASPFLVMPTRLLQVKPGELLIVDSLATPPGTTLHGALFRAKIATGELVATLQDPRLERLQALATVARPAPTIRRFVALEDSAGWWHQSGDTLHCELLLANPSIAPEPYAVAEIELPATVELVTGSEAATAGTVMPAAEGLSWEGALGAGDSVRIEYQVRLHLRPGESPWSLQHAELQAAYSAGARQTLWHYLRNTTLEGELLVIDRAANPLALGQATGALMRLQGPARTIVPIAAGPGFHQPVDVSLLPGSLTDCLVVDWGVTGTGGGRGALLRVTTRTGEIMDAYRDSTLRQPYALAVVDSQTVYLLDREADPWGLGAPVSPPGPGAVYRIDLTGGTAEVVASDTRFLQPADLIYEAASGQLYLIDEGAGTGQFDGAVYRIDTSSGMVTLVTESGGLLEPTAGLLNRDGDLLVLDVRGSQGAIVWRIGPGGLPTSYATCPEAVEPNRLMLDGNGNLLVVDSSADPGDLSEEGTGSILRLRAGETFCSLYAGGRPLVWPSAATVRFAATPVLTVALAASLEAGGIALRWDPPPHLTGAEYYIYRRQPERPGSEYTLLNPQAPLQGSGAPTYLDGQVVAGELYEYRVAAYLPDATRFEFGPVEIRAAGEAIRFALAPPQPNPLVLQADGSGVLVRFTLPTAVGAMELAVYDVGGRRRRTLRDGRCDAGRHALAWDGRDDAGRRLASGLYFLRLEAEGRTARRRIMILR